MGKRILIKMVWAAIFFVVFFWLGPLLLSTIPFVFPPLLILLISILVVGSVLWWVFGELVPPLP